MSDLISRADAICEVLVNDGIENIVDRINKLPSADAVDCTDFIEWLVDRVLDETVWENNSVAYGEIICRKLEKLGVLEVTEEPSYYIRQSAEAVSEDTQTEERARFVAKETELAHIEAKLENAEKRLQGACTANFVAEQLDRLRNMTDEERWDFFIKFFSPSAEAVTIHEDGTLEVKVSNAHKVGRVLVTDTESHIGGGLFYPDDAEAEWIPCSERLPKAEDMYQIPEQRYLCQLEAHGERKFCVLSRLKGAVSPFWDWYGIAVYDSDVIAWMPLPEPYREDGEV